MNFPFKVWVGGSSNFTEETKHPPRLHSHPRFLFISRLCWKPTSKRMRTNPLPPTFTAQLKLTGLQTACWPRRCTFTSSETIMFETCGSEFVFRVEANLFRKRLFSFQKKTFLKNRFLFVFRHTDNPGGKLLF